MGSGKNMIITRSQGPMSIISETAGERRSVHWTEASISMRAARVII